MVGRDPASIVALVGTGGNGLTRGGRLVVDESGLLALGGSGLLGRGEECLNVGLVDKVRDTSKGGT